MKLWPDLENASMKDLITIDPEILGGTPVFKGTRVPGSDQFVEVQQVYVRV